MAYVWCLLAGWHSNLCLLDKQYLFFLVKYNELYKAMGNDDKHRVPYYLLSILLLQRIALDDDGAAADDDEDEDIACRFL